KPHPAIYQQALNSLYVMPEEAAMVGNNLVADVLGAQRLGLFTVWKPKSANQAQIQMQMQAAAQAPQAQAPQAQAPQRQAAEREAVSAAVTAVPRDTSDDRFGALLFDLARQRAQTRHPEARTMSPPDAIIMQVSDVLRIFRQPTESPIR